MYIPYRPLALIGLVSVVFAAIVWDRVQAGDGHFYAPVTDPVVKEECGSCHLAFAPSMLPASSWKYMMSKLDNHFGDNASIDAATAERITSYLVANAGDAGGRRYGSKLLQGVTADSAPQRITELPNFVHEHHEVHDWEWRHQNVRSKANCVACHPAAAQGYYDD